MLSIIVPVLDEEAGIAATLQALSALRARGAEVIVADGASRDRTVALARPLCDRLIVAARGRASQMNAGASAARGDDPAVPACRYAAARGRGPADHGWP